MSHNRDLSAAAAQLGFHSSNIGIGSDNPGNKLDVAGDVKILDNSPRLFFYDANATGASNATGGFEVFDKDGNKNVFVGAFAPNADNLIFGVTGTERLRITSDGKVGIGTEGNTAPTAPLSIKVGSGGEYVQDFRGSATKQFGFFYNQNNWNAATFRIDEFDNNGTATSRLTITDGGKVGVGCDAEVDFQVRNGNGGTIKIGGSGTSATGFQIQYNNSGTTTTELLTNYRSTSSSASLKIDTGTFLVATGTNGAERLRITPAGDIGVGTNNPNHKLTLFQSGTGTFDAVNFVTGNTNSSGYQMGINSSGEVFHWNTTNSSINFATNNVERMRLYANGKLHLGNSHIDSNNLTRLHVGWNTGGTVAGESIIAGTLGNDTTAVSALLTMKNAGNRGAQGASGGSSLAKFEFNNGTAFEIDKYGRRTLQYQPGCKVSIDTNGTGGGNNTQTGKTILPFNSTGFGYNIGNHFNTSNHTFTAPLAGRYLVLLSLNVIGDNIVYIYKNGSANMGGEYRSNPNGIWEHCELCGVIDCSANDTIKAHSYLISSSGRKFNGGSNPGTYWDTLSIYYLG